jgi:hypothetical protein
LSVSFLVDHVSSLPWLLSFEDSHASISRVPSAVVYARKIHMLEDVLFDSKGGTQPIMQGNIWHH